MKMKFYQSLNQKLTTKKGSAGFTLIELILAASLMGIVITVSGWGLSAILLANERGEAESRITENLSRALDFMSDDIRTANLAVDSSNTNNLPTWAWSGSQLGITSASPTAKLYLQIPLTVESTDESNDTITINNHGFSNGNAVIFTGTGTPPTGLNKYPSGSSVYYVTAATANTFKLASSISDAESGTAINFTGNITNGTLSANRLVIYYMRKNTDSWLKPNTVNRSVGPCVSPYADSNCPALVDAISGTPTINNSPIYVGTINPTLNLNGNGFIANVSNRQVTLYLRGQLNQNSISKPLITTAFVRNTAP